MDRALTERVHDFCLEHGMFDRDDTVIVALSGGGDSVALLHILLDLSGRLGITCLAAHLDHGLRGRESQEDERFCRELCATAGIDYVAGKLKPGEIASVDGSLETAAREMRHEFLDRVRDEHGARRIATGHTLDDQAETVLQRLVRGTGPSGLQGIRPVRGSRVSPLLCAGREELRTFLEMRGIPFREDSSNMDMRFTRNNIRHRLIPMLSDGYNPSVTTALARLADISRDQEDYLDERTGEAYSECIINSGRGTLLLDARQLAGFHPAIRQRVVRYALEVLDGEGRDSNQDEINRVLDVLADGGGTCDVSSGIRFEATSEMALFLRELDTYASVRLEVPGKTVLPSGWGTIEAAPVRSGAADGQSAVMLDRMLEREYGPFTLGPVRRGERMKVFGTGSAKRMVELLNEAGIPGSLRTVYPVLRAGSVPLWLPGVRSSALMASDAVPAAGDGENVVGLIYRNGPLQRTHELRRVRRR